MKVESGSIRRSAFAQIVWQLGFLSTSGTFGLVLQLRLGRRLPLHVFRSIDATTCERRFVVDHVTLHPPKILPFTGHGFDAWKERLAAALRGILP